MNVIIAGNPVDGFTVTGPFADESAATEYAEQYDATGYWWLAPLQTPDEAPVTLVTLQQGGSSGEVYINATDNAEEAAEFRRSCEEGAYATSESIEVPAALAAHGEALYTLLEEVARAAVELP